MKSLANFPDAYFDVSPFKFLFWEKRCHVREIIDGLKIPFNSEIDVTDVYHAIVTKAKAERMRPDNYDWTLFDGVLYCDGEKIKRVGPKAPRPCYDSRADYWEGRCLDMRPSIYWE